MSEKTAAMIRARRAAGAVGGLRKLSQTSLRGTKAGVVQRTGERCDLCGTTIPEDHRHLLQLDERRIDCACEPCFAMRGGDAEYRPTGMRVVWLEDFELNEEIWASFQIPIGLAFILHSTGIDRMVALYPSPAGATECELYLESWNELVRVNPILETLESDGEALVVNRMADPHEFAIAPIDDCYRLVGIIKANWEGISGGPDLHKGIASFFDELRQRAESA